MLGTVNRHLQHSAGTDAACLLTAYNILEDCQPIITCMTWMTTILSVLKSRH